MKNFIKIVGLLTSAFLSLPAAAGGDVARGNEKAQPCVACHGEAGNKPISYYPKLAGQHVDYLAQALRAYKNGGRANAVMAGLAKELSDEDIDDLSAYFSSQSGDLR